MGGYARRAAPRERQTPTIAALRSHSWRPGAVCAMAALCASAEMRLASRSRSCSVLSLTSRIAARIGEASAAGRADTAFALPAFQASSRRRWNSLSPPDP